MKRTVFLLIAVAFFGDCYLDAAQATAIEERLHAILLRFPTADLNHDGILTTDELFLITEDAGGGFGAHVGHPSINGQTPETSASEGIGKIDPPILMNCTMPLKASASFKDTPKREPIHNPMLRQLLKRKLDVAGVENYLYHVDNKAPPDAG